MVAFELSLRAFTYPYVKHVIAGRLIQFCASTVVLSSVYKLFTSAFASPSQSSVTIAVQYFKRECSSICARMQSDTSTIYYYSSKERV